MSLYTLSRAEEVRNQCRTWKLERKRLAFVPTMGALHDGHLSLVKQAQEQADRVIVSIFVNPLQFGPKEDFSSYPRMLENDSRKLAEAGVDLLFAPDATEMYPPAYQTYVLNEGMSNILCGRFRPGHFQGVLTVVSKLFHIVQPELAIFGKKDYQQFKLISKMVRDLMFDITLVGSETLREKDGLAMSSRNLRLSPEERSLAPRLFAAMEELKAAYRGGQTDVVALVDKFKGSLARSEAFRLEYAEIRDQENLTEYSTVIDSPAVFLVAAHLGNVRLIDNLEL